MQIPRSALVAAVKPIEKELFYMKKIIAIMMFLLVITMGLSACSPDNKYIIDDNEETSYVEDSSSFDSQTSDISSAQPDIPVQQKVNIIEAKNFSDGVVWVKQKDESKTFWSCLDTKGTTQFSLDEGKEPATDFVNGIAIIGFIQGEEYVNSGWRPKIIKTDVIDKTGKIIWSVEEHGKNEGERLFGAGALDSIEMIAERNSFLGYIFVKFHVETFEYSGTKLGVLDSQCNWYLDPSHDQYDLTTMASLDHEGMGIYRIHLNNEYNSIYYNLLTNEFLGETSYDIVGDWIEQNRNKVDKDTLTFKAEGDENRKFVDPGFYNESGEKIIDLSSYNIPSYSAPFFINGYAVIDIENDQGAKYMTVINKSGEQMASPIKYLEHGNVVSGLFWIKNEDNTFSYMDTTMNVVISDLTGHINDFTLDGIATIKDSDGTYYFIDTTGKRMP